MPNIKWVLQKARVKPFVYLMDYSISKNEVTLTYIDQTAKKFDTKLEASYYAARVFDETDIVWEPRAIAWEENQP